MNFDRLIMSLDAASVRWVLALLHFLWQGVAIAGLTAAVMALMNVSALRRRIARLLGVAAEPRVRLARVWPLAASLLLSVALAVLALSRPTASNADPPVASSTTAGDWGPADAGLVCRVVAVAPQTEEQHPDFATATRMDHFARVEELTLLAELKNVSDKPLSLQGTRYGDSVTQPWPGKSSSVEFAPLLFSYEFFDKAGKPIVRPARKARDTDAMLRLSGGTAETVAPGKSLVVLLRPADADVSLASHLSGGEYQVSVRYHGPLPGVRKEMQRVWPKAGRKNNFYKLVLLDVAENAMTRACKMQASRHGFAESFVWSLSNWTSGE